MLQLCLPLQPDASRMINAAMERACRSEGQNRIQIVYTQTDRRHQFVYTTRMEIVWDEPKRLANLDKHDLDFADLNEAFFADALSFRPRKSLERDRS
jgi:hypothetical protein